MRERKRCLERRSRNAALRIDAIQARSSFFLSNRTGPHAPGKQVPPTTNKTVFHRRIQRSPQTFTNAEKILSPY
eukprot:1196415-Prorocentrum_minimum.AAC.4